MENQVKRGQRGGKREGSGRKKTTSKTYGFNAPESVVEILEKVPNKTDFIIQAILEKNVFKYYNSLYVANANIPPHTFYGILAW